MLSKSHNDVLKTTNEDLLCNAFLCPQSNTRRYIKPQNDLKLLHTFAKNLTRGHETINVAINHNMTMEYYLG